MEGFCWPTPCAFAKLAQGVVPTFKTRQAIARITSDPMRRVAIGSDSRFLACFSLSAFLAPDYGTPRQILP